MRRNLILKLITTLIITVLTFFVIQNCVFAQDKAAEIDKLMQLYHDYDKFNGTVLVAECGEIIFKKGYGLANMEWNIANEPDTKLRLASIAKQFTSMLIMQLVEEGKIKLDGKITDYLPGYRKDTGEQVTVHHLLTHTSGIPNYTNLPNFFKDVSRNPYPVDEFIEKFCSGDLEFEPGSKFSYNNSGYFLLGGIIEKVTGKTYEECLKERIFDPLNMKNSGYDHNESIILNRASGYIKHFSKYENAEYADMSTAYAVGAMYSTVEDLYLWDRALYTEKLLSKKYKNLMFKPHISFGDGSMSYAYGWYIRKMALADSKDSLVTVSHEGSIFGFNTLINRLVDDKHLIVLLNNTGGTNLHDMNVGIINILYGKPYNLPKKSIAEALYKKIKEKDVASAIKHYYELRDIYPDDYDFSKDELNWLGVSLRDWGMLEEAIEIYKWIIELYPDWFESYNGIADVYRLRGDKELAIKYYAKSLEMNPERWYAILISEALKRVARRITRK